MSNGGLKETEMPAGSPETTAEGSSLSREVPTIVGVSVEVRVPPMPPVTLPSVAVRVNLVTASLDWGGIVEEDVDVVDDDVVDDDVVVEVELDVVDVTVVLVVEVVVDVVEEVEPEGASASPISTQPAPS